MSYIEKLYEFWMDKQWDPISGQILTVAAGLVLVAGFGGFAEMILHSDYGFGGIVAILVIYLLRNQKEVAFAMGVLALTIFCGSIEFIALFMLLCLVRYDGTRGKSMKYVFYAFYPIHLLNLALICMMLGV